MSKSNLEQTDTTSQLAPLALALAIAAGVAWSIPGTKPAGLTDGWHSATDNAAHSFSLSAQAQDNSDSKSPSSRSWTASAPGKVEPRHGEIRITPQLSGRIVDIAVKVNDDVRAGDLLIRLDDDEARARVRAASALADSRKRARDNDDAGELASTRRKADDAVFDARYALRQAREDLDIEAALARASNNNRDNLDAARARVADALTSLTKARAQLRAAQSVPNLPLETARESALSAARADLALAEVMLERTQIRAPSHGTVLDVIARKGETVAPSPSNLLIRFGDLSALRVRAEVEERDVGNVRVGQRVTVRSNAFPGKEFSGTVSTRARTLGPNKISAKGPRRPTDLDVLEAMIDIEGQPALLPGMRVDVYFMTDEAAKSKAAKSKAAKSKAASTNEANAVVQKKTN